MAARRLLAVMLVFLAISTVLAVLAPPPADQSTTSTTSTTTVPEPERAAEGKLVAARVAVTEGKGGELVADPAVVSAAVGDQLAVEIAVPFAVTLQAPTLGVVETAVPGSPARLDLFASAPATHPIEDSASGNQLVRIRIAEEREGARNEAGSRQTAEGKESTRR